MARAKGRLPVERKSSSQALQRVTDKPADEIVDALKRHGFAGSAAEHELGRV